MDEVKSAGVRALAAHAMGDIVQGNRPEEVTPDILKKIINEAVARTVADIHEDVKIGCILMMNEIARLEDARAERGEV